MATDLRNSLGNRSPCIAVSRLRNGRWRFSAIIEVIVRPMIRSLNVRPLRSTLGTEFVRDDNARLAPRFEQRREKSRRCDLVAV